MLAPNKSIASKTPASKPSLFHSSALCLIAAFALALGSCAKPETTKPIPGRPLATRPPVASSGCEHQGVHDAARARLFSQADAPNVKSAVISGLNFKNQT